MVGPDAGHPHLAAQLASRREQRVAARDDGGDQPGGHRLSRTRMAARDRGEQADLEFRSRGQLRGGRRAHADRERRRDRHRDDRRDSRDQ
ncbi:MAG: hypothetical protein DMF80_10470 [Acidobacteria bacterium]|nr:MAG: hypothetical protein DMF80_10470 [Acidobacteriota bacterium]